MHIRKSWCVSIKHNIYLHVWLLGGDIDVVSLQLIISYISIRDHELAEPKQRFCNV